MDFKELEKSPRMLSALVDMLAEMAIDDPDAPEEMRVSSKIMLADHKLKETICKATRRFIVKLGPDASPEDIKCSKEFLAYLECVIAGFDNFMSQYEAE